MGVESAIRGAVPTWFGESRPSERFARMLGTDGDRVPRLSGVRGSRRSGAGTQAEETGTVPAPRTRSRRDKCLAGPGAAILTRHSDPLELVITRTLSRTWGRDPVRCSAKSRVFPAVSDGCLLRLIARMTFPSFHPCWMRSPTASTSGEGGGVEGSTTGVRLFLDAEDGEILSEVRLSRPGLGDSAAGTLWRTSRTIDRLGRRERERKETAQYRQ